MLSYFANIVTIWALFAGASVLVAALREEVGFLHVGAMAFMAVGAYTSAILTTTTQISPWLSLLVTLPVGAVLGGITHLLVQRLRGDGLALATLALGVIVHGFLLNAVGLTGGPMGITGIPPLVLTISAISPVLVLPVSAVLLLLLLLVGLARVRMSTFGQRMRALRDNEDLAEDLSLRPSSVRAVVWAGSSALLALIGGFYAFYLRYIDPSSFSASESVSILAMAMLLVGPHGAIVGALLFVGIPEALRFVGISAGTGAHVRQLLFGIVLLAVIVQRSRTTGIRNA